MLKIAWSSIYAHPLPENHRFPMEKYDLLPRQLIHEGTISQENIFKPTLLEEKWILKAHDKVYWENLKHLRLTKSEIRKTGFPLSQELVDREITIAQGTVMCCDYALKYGVAMNIAGGTHHAFTDHGEGFCLLNDIAIGAYYLMETQKFNRILVIDLDVHQGNGTAQIFEKDARVFTFSMHGAKNYPMHKENSDLDIPLPDNTIDDEYLRQLKKNLNHLIPDIKPEFIFYQCGVDVLATDKLGRLSLSIEGCKSRDKLVLEIAKLNEIPIMASMGGGYSEDIKLIIEAHANTFRLAKDIYF